MTRYDLSTTRDEIITQALRKVVLGDGESPTTAMLDNAAKMLNYLLKQWTLDTASPYRYVEVTETLIEADSTLTSFSDQGVIGLFHVYYLEGTLKKPVEVIEFVSWAERSSEYDLLKTGLPEICTLANTGEIDFRPVPDKDYTIYLHTFKSEAEFDNGSDAALFPDRYFLAAVYGLASLLSDDYKLPISERNKLEISYRTYLSNAKRFEKKNFPTSKRVGGAY